MSTRHRKNCKCCHQSQIAEQAKFESKDRALVIPNQMISVGSIDKSLFATHDLCHSKSQKKYGAACMIYWPSIPQLTSDTLLYKKSARLQSYPIKCSQRNMMQQVCSIGQASIPTLSNHQILDSAMMAALTIGTDQNKLLGTMNPIKINLAQKLDTAINQLIFDCPDPKLHLPFKEFCS